jgi:hypothetical protein
MFVKHGLIDVLHGVRSDETGGNMRGAGTIKYPNQVARRRNIDDRVCCPSRCHHTSKVLIGSWRRGICNGNCSSISLECLCHLVDGVHRLVESATTSASTSTSAITSTATIASVATASITATVSTSTERTSVGIMAFLVALETEDLAVCIVIVFVVFAASFVVFVSLSASTIFCSMWEGSASDFKAVSTDFVGFSRGLEHSFRGLLAALLRRSKTSGSNHKLFKCLRARGEYQVFPKLRIENLLVLRDWITIGGKSCSSHPNLIGPHLQRRVLRLTKSKLIVEL